MLSDVIIDLIDSKKSPIFRTQGPEEKGMGPIPVHSQRSMGGLMRSSALNLETHNSFVGKGGLNHENR
jgi:hypothetical protein